MSGVAAALRVAASFALAADAVAVAVAGISAFAPIALLAAGAITLVLAVPAYLVLRRFRRETWLDCIAAGFLVGATAAAGALLPV